jgi:HEAT repeat protein
MKRTLPFFALVFLAISGPGAANAPADLGPAQAACIQDDVKTEMAALRAEIAKLRAELQAAVKEIKDLKEALRQPAAPTQEALYRGKPASFWLVQAKDGDPKFRTEAIQALGSLAQQDKKLVPTLIAASKDKDSQVGPAATDALAGLGRDGVPALLAVLKDTESTAGLRNAAWAVVSLGPKAKAAVPMLIKALKNDDVRVREAAVYALGSIGPDAKPAIPALVDLFGSSLERFAAERELALKKNAGLPNFSGSLPSVCLVALVRADPDAEAVLPKELRPRDQSLGGDPRFFVEPGREIPLCRQAYVALKKRYEKEK